MKNKKKKTIITLTSILRKILKPNFHNGLRYSPSGSILIANTKCKVKGCKKLTKIGERCYDVCWYHDLKKRD